MDEYNIMDENNLMDETNIMDENIISHKKMYHGTLVMYHGTLTMYHGTLSMYHGTSAMYHGIFSYGLDLIACIINDILVYSNQYDIYCVDFKVNYSL